MSIPDALDAAAYLIAQPGKWHQDGLASDGHGWTVDPTSPRARCWCGLGAIAAVLKVDVGDVTVNPYWEAAGWADFANWQDEPGRTADEAVARLRECAERARVGAAA